MADETYNVLVLCAGNSARSIIGECLVNRLGGGRWKGFSAGSSPAGEVNPHALRLLQEKGFEVAGLRSKSWDEFAGPDAPHMDLVITVCDNAAGESCPPWPGSPLRAHWSIPDPAAVRGDEEKTRRAFLTAHDQLEKRIRALVQLDHGQSDPAILQAQINAI